MYLSACCAPLPQSVLHFHDCWTLLEHGCSFINPCPGGIAKSKHHIVWYHDVHHAAAYHTPFLVQIFTNIHTNCIDKGQNLSRPSFSVRVALPRIPAMLGPSLSYPSVSSQELSQSQTCGGSKHPVRNRQPGYPGFDPPPCYDDMPLQHYPTTTQTPPKKINHMSLQWQCCKTMAMLCTG